MTRKTFLSYLALTALGLRLQAEETQPLPMPALFLGHGSPMNITAANSYTAMLHELGTRLRRPEAIVVLSAHWYTEGTLVGSDARPGLLYDFFGFPDALYEIGYDAPGSPELARRIARETGAAERPGRGLDHGAWALLHHLFPGAEIPVLQVSLDRNRSMAEHAALGRQLAFLRTMGVLVIGSGNVTHNLRMATPSDDTPPPQWAVDFDAYVSRAVAERDIDALADYGRAGSCAAMAHPTLEHYLPLLYIAAMAEEEEPVTTLFEGFQNGSISMKGWMVGRL